jgi:hypothetical protein
LANSGNSLLKANRLLTEYEREMKRKTNILKWQRNGWFLGFAASMIWAAAK